MSVNPCLTCGACCAMFKASFHWSECDDATPGGVPVALTEDAGLHRRVMKGTLFPPVRCIALEGAIGNTVHCSIYERRASVCRAFMPSYENGVPNERCDKARLAHGLIPLRPEDWSEDDDPPIKPLPRKPRGGRRRFRRAA